ncbi:MAG: hypothetical protein HW388_1684, partial [Dehalococcoidia bacterium]|nr:hypothetical protein [Dehalococcoidia bacterium]
IQRWFPLITYYDINKCNDSADAGSTFFDGPGIGANLTPLGEFFRNRVMGVSQ